MKTLLCKVCLFIICIGCSCKTIAQDSYIDSLKKVLQTEKEDTNKVITLDNICDYYYYAGDYENTMQTAKSVLALSTKINYKIGIADGYLNIGLAYNVKKDRFNETEYFNKALALYKQIGDKQQIFNCYEWMNGAYIIDEDAAKALESVYAAQKVREQTGDKKTIADGFLNIASTFSNIDGYSSSNNVEQQLKNELSALKLYKELNDRNGIGTISSMIGSNYFLHGKYSEALNKYAGALQILKGSERLDELANIYGLIGMAYEGQGDSAYDKGNKNFAADKYLEAQKNQLISLREYQAYSVRPAVRMCYYILGNLNIKLNNLNTAKKYLDSSFAIAQSLGTQIIDIYKAFAKLDSIEGNYKDAYKNYKLYKFYSDSTFNEEGIKKTVQVQMQYAFDKKEAIAKAEQEKKDAEAKRLKNQQYFAIAALGIIVLAVVIIASIQFRNNKQKQKANLLLERQKQKVESTLTELKSTQAQLVQSEKMASLGELTAGIAHEIQNPLNFVNNFSEVNQEMIDELLSEKSKVRSERNEELENEILNDIKDNEEKINHHGKRADAIVKGMLQHSRQTKGVKEPTDINALCDEYLRLAFHGLRAKDKDFNADFKVDFDESIGKISIVPQDIGRVLLNLFNNAFYAVNEKKKLMANSYQPLAEVKTRRVNNKIEIIVSDNGNGIPQNIIDKIFQPFFTTKPTGEGTGLGLSLSYDIITKEHNGTIKVESKEGEGSMFVIEVPA